MTLFDYIWISPIQVESILFCLIQFDQTDSLSFCPIQFCYIWISPIQVESLSFCFIVWSYWFSVIRSNTVWFIWISPIQVESLFYSIWYSLIKSIHYHSVQYSLIHFLFSASNVAFLSPESHGEGNSRVHRQTQNSHCRAKSHWPLKRHSPATETPNLSKLTYRVCLQDLQQSHEYLSVILYRLASLLLLIQLLTEQRWRAVQ